MLATACTPAIDASLDPLIACPYVTDEEPKNIYIRLSGELKEKWSETCQRLGGQNRVGLALVELFLMQDQATQAKLIGIIPAENGSVEISTRRAPPPSKAAPGRHFPRAAAKPRPGH